MNEPLVVGYRFRGNNFDINYHSHLEHYEIYFFHAGSCRYLINNQIYDLIPGDILLMDGKTLHKPNVDPSSEYVRSVVHFSPKWIQGILTELKSLHVLEVFEKLHHCLIRTNENDESKRLEHIIWRLADLQNNSKRYNTQPEAEMKVLLIEMLLIVNRIGQVNSRKILSSRTEKAEHAENIAVFIQNHYTEKLTLDGIAASLNLSKSYVSHVFKEMTGFTVMEHLMGCRLTQVKYLLEMEPTKPLKDVAFESGFESVSHFSRYFKEKVGVTAKDYRQLRSQINN
ncbi:AraC family transcriptional regulator [Paraliobacillus sediminis]|uniref:AraC family transcriptional regulator n=1 Tax=Paraliobacillus sediminis TaxID=1885916 RepID=UPI0013C3639B|nr:helix-turn-helix domain-containing protein [Paraliobacillus sediminis]